MLQTAQQAAAQQNWSHVTQVLRQYSPHLPQASPLEQEQALDLALDTLLWGDFQDRWEVAKVLPSLGSLAFDSLTTLLLDEAIAFEVRWFAARILGEFQDPAAVAPLVQCLQTADDPEVGQVAALALASLGEVAIAPLAQALDALETRTTAIQALTQIHHAAIVEPLLTVREQPDAQLRAQIIEALSNFQAPHLLPILIQALNDPSSLVRKEAVVGLGLWATVQSKVAAQGIDLLQVLQPCLEDINLEVCQQAAIALGRLNTPAAADLLLGVLQRETTPLPLQRDLIRALGWMELSQVLTAFGDLLPTLNTASQGEVIRALGRISNPELHRTATHLLLNFYHTTPDLPISIQQELTQAWGHLGAVDAIEVLQQLAESAIATVRLHAIAALKVFAAAPSSPD